MARFKVGDKVTLSEKFYKDYPSLEEDNSWVKRLRRKVEKDGYITIAEAFDYGYKNEELDVYLPENWLEPYIEQGPLTLLTEDGLSVRDHFAMAALMCFRTDVFIAPEYIAEKAYKVADAMMERRKRE